jgi:hypothetical protein
LGLYLQLFGHWQFKTKTNASCAPALDLERSTVRFENAAARMKFSRPLRRIVWEGERWIVEFDREAFIRRCPASR